MYYYNVSYWFIIKLNKILKCQWKEMHVNKEVYTFCFKFLRFYKYIFYDIGWLGYYYIYLSLRLQSNCIFLKQ